MYVFNREFPSYVSSNQESVDPSISVFLWDSGRHGNMIQLLLTPLWNMLILN